MLIIATQNARLTANLLRVPLLLTAREPRSRTTSVWDRIALGAVWEISLVARCGLMG